MNNHNARYPVCIAPTSLAQQNQNYGDLLASQNYQPASSAILSSLSTSSTSPPSMFFPTASTVVIGKGSVPKKAPGNMNLRALVQTKIEAYVNASSKIFKSSIVTDIYFAIEYSCRKEGNPTPFVRYDKHGYAKTSESIAREKITSTFRDCLHHKYKSSSKNKVAKRRIANKKKAEMKREIVLLNFLKKDLLQIAPSDECAPSSPALVQSSCQPPQQQQQQQQQFQSQRQRLQPQQQQQLYPQQQQQLYDKTINSYQNMCEDLFVSNQLFPKRSLTRSLSATGVEIDWNYKDIEPIPIPQRRVLVNRNHEGTGWNYNMKYI